MPPAEVHITSDSDLESVISNQNTKAKPRRNSTKPKYNCSIDGCSASFKRLAQLDKHEYKHTGIRKHICSYDGCDKAYTIITHLKRHLNSTHERAAPPQKDVPCEVEGCDKRFPSVCNMQRHIRQVHENPKVYRCAHCDEKFTQKLKMRRHEITQHTGDYPYSCNKCEKGFYQEWQYKRHLPTCKIYPCPNCDMQFEKWSLYRKHCKDTKHGRMYYQCEHCTRVYSKPGELQQHIRAKHLNLPAGVEQMLYKCTSAGCDRRYNYERNLKQHMRTAHSGLRFHCTEAACLRAFRSTQNLSKHIKREHNQEKVEGDIVMVETGKATGKRRKRVDAGQPLISNLAKLSGLAVNKSFDKLLRQREHAALAEVANVLGQNVENEQITTDAEKDDADMIDVPQAIKGKINSSMETGNSAEKELDTLVAIAFQGV